MIDDLVPVVGYSGPEVLKALSMMAIPARAVNGLVVVNDEYNELIKLAQQV
ncbi:hypothetical protein KQ940_01670 [Marinobacterium sp. D7]|uniref:hypothetical protein n=1 Tax=Marinobacterium ramblicola TaxID=2849041 RepID=UPI001C2D210E|nr:hypothetical protein [Marinobacterium ramblicola]MBV1786760.1 hypothetical protein [Marinobacterium ramblicola]